MNSSPLVSSRGHRLDWLKVQNTRLCNFSCGFCSQGDWAGNEAVDLAALKLAVFDRLSSLRLLIATGGEPLARYGNLLELTGLARQKGSEVGIFSNLSLLTPARAQELKEAGVRWYRTTLNGPSAAVHEDSYPAGSFEKTLKGIAAAAAAGAVVKVRTTVYRANSGHLVGLAAFVASLGVRELDFRPYMPLGDCNPHSSFALQTPELLETAATLFRLKACWQGRLQIKLLPNWFDFLYRDLAGELPSACELCHCGRSYLYIDAAGNYRACAGHRAIAGSIFTDRIEDVWSDSAFLAEVRDYEQADFCRTCPQRTTCHAANCHLINYEAHARFDGVNPTCPIFTLSPTSAAHGYEQVRRIFQEAYSRHPGSRNGFRTALEVASHDG